MRIRMLVDFPVSVSGFKVETWEAGAIYEAPEELAQALIRDGHARDAYALPPLEVKPAPTVETKPAPKRRKAR